LTPEDDKKVGMTKDSGYQVGVRRTIAVPPTQVWDFVFSPEGLTLWLGPTGEFSFLAGKTYKLGDGATGEVRIFKKGSHARLTWQPGDYPRPSTIQVRIIDKGHKTTIAFHQEHLPDSTIRESRREHFMHALEAIEFALSDG
jgi:uncharacterized protein YndB with AHSA1/START domain